MLRDELKRLPQQLPSRRNAMPRRGARWVRQWNEIEFFSGTRAAKTTSDDLIKFSDWHELRDGQFPHRDNQPRLQNFKLAIQPRRAVCDLLGIGDAVASARGFPRKTATDRGEINLRANRFFREPGCFLEPAKKRLARGPGKRFARNRLPHPGRLADQQYFAHYWAPGNRWRMHQGATPAVPQSRDMPLEPRLFLHLDGHLA
jgi:hypothetical protein